MKYTRIVKSKSWLRNSAERHYFDSNYNYNKYAMENQVFFIFFLFIRFWKLIDPLFSL